MNKQMILDAGSGHNPWFHADVLCDRFLGPTIHRGHLAHEPAIQDGRPFVCCDLHALPFKPKAFSFVLCRQVLEHVDAPQVALTELKRVGRHGLATFPSQVWERFFHSCLGHQWMLIPHGETLHVQNVRVGWGGVLRRMSSRFFERNFRIHARECLITLFQRVFQRNIAFTTIRW